MIQLMQKNLSARLALADKKYFCCQFNPSFTFEKFQSSKVDEPEEKIKITKMAMGN